MAYYDALIAKWATLSPGSNDAKLTQINALTVAGPAAAMIVPTYKIYNVIDPTEFGALSAGNQQLVRDILSMGTVDGSPGTAVRTRLTNLFGAGSATRTALLALAATFDATTIPWWQSAGYRHLITGQDLVDAGLQPAEQVTPLG